MKDPRLLPGRSLRKKIFFLNLGVLKTFLNQRLRPSEKYLKNLTWKKILKKEIHLRVHGKMLLAKSSYKDPRVLRK